MKNKNRLRTNNLRAITGNFSRFFSLMVMSFLGVLVYVGLQSTSPDMINTLDEFYKEHNVYDFKIMSTMGLTDNDVSFLKKIKNVEYSEGNKSLDTLVTVNDVLYVINISSLPKEINNLDLIDGRFPNKNNEIIVEPNFLRKNNVKLGDTITIENDNLKEKEFIVVGTVDSALYFNNVSITQFRANTSLGTGTVHYYAFVSEDIFNTDYYSSIYLKLSYPKKMTTSESKYISFIKDNKKELENIREERELVRLNEIVDKANKEIDEEEKKAYKELNKAKNTLNSSKKKLDNAASGLNKAKKELNKNKKALDNYSKKISNAEKELNNTLKSYNINKNDIAGLIIELDNNINLIKTAMSMIDSESIEYQLYENELNNLETRRATLVTLKNNINNLELQKKKLYSSKKQYQQALKEYNSNYNLYKRNLSKYEKGLKEYKDNKKEVDQKIKEAREEVKNIKKPTWIINDRSNYQTYTEYIDDTNSIKNLSMIFPVVFFAVAILVSLVSMNRMVEDDRGEIGTLKSLGFSNMHIVKKYLLFSSLATVFGGIIGVLVGYFLIPMIIFNIYGMLFTLPKLTLLFNIKAIIISFLISLICICGSSLLTTIHVLKENTAGLLRPKAPKIGKKIFLEKIKLIWSHLNFSHKVTIRNIFRYKKRVSITIFGIAGCTALILCGFGIRDAIVDIAQMQYKNMFTYDAGLFVNDADDKRIDEIFSNDKIKDYTKVLQKSVTLNDKSVTLFISEDDESLKRIANLKDEKGNDIDINNNVIITEKISKILNVKKGDTITLIDTDNNSYTYKIDYISKNYIGHYVFINSNIFEEEFKPNTIFIHTYDSESNDELSLELLENEEILNITFVDKLMETVDNMLNSLNKVVAILIVLAALLAFVVLYNLSNINIHERKREVATLKVLGFYDREVDSYITKETFILTLIGIALGLIIGYFFTSSVITTVEIEKAKFIHHIQLESYIYSALLAASFTLIVNFITHFTLKKINMIESLKNVE